MGIFQLAPIAPFLFVLLADSVSAQSSVSHSGTAGGATRSVTVNYSGAWQLVSRDRSRDSDSDRDSVVSGGVTVAVARVSAAADGIVAEADGGALAQGGSSVAASADTLGYADMSFLYNGEGTGSAKVSVVASARASIGSMTGANTAALVSVSAEFDSTIGPWVRARVTRFQQGTSTSSRTPNPATANGLTLFDWDSETRAEIFASTTNNGPASSQVGVTNIAAVAWVSATINLQ